MSPVQAPPFGAANAVNHYGLIFELSQCQRIIPPLLIVSASMPSPTVTAVLTQPSLHCLEQVRRAHHLTSRCRKNREVSSLKTACYFSVLEECIKLYQQPLLTYVAGDATKAFKTLQDRNRMTNKVLKMPPDITIVPSIRSASSFVLYLKGFHLLAGGLGGLDRSVATWMVEHGARSLILLSSNAGLNERDQAFLKELESMRYNVSAVAGMAQNLEDVVKAISSAAGSIKGVIQLAMVLRVGYISLKSQSIAHFIYKLKFRINPSSI